MSKGLKVFSLFIIFVVGISCGIYYYGRESSYLDSQYHALNQSIQDIVIKNVQEENKVEQNTSEVTSKPEKVSPYAKITVEKYFTKCTHTTVDIIDVPKEVVNLTEEEFAEKYKGWLVRIFTPKEITIYKEFDAKCSEHFVVKETDGYVAVYNEITPEKLELNQITDIDIKSLRTDDQYEIVNGISIYGKKELSYFLEDFNS